MTVLVGISLHICLNILARDILTGRLARSKDSCISHCDAFCQTAWRKSIWFAKMIGISQTAWNHTSDTFLLKPRKEFLNLIPNMLLTYSRQPLLGRRLTLEGLYISIEGRSALGRNKGELASPPLAHWLMPKDHILSHYPECITDCGCVRIYLPPASCF